MQKTLLFVLSSILLTSVVAVSSTDVTKIKQSALLILMSTSSYQKALDFAREFSDTTKIKLVHESRKNKEIGLTYTKKYCEEMGYSHPCYIARGGYDDGIYISIEYSNAYQGFQKGYYIVVAASGKYASLIEREIQKHLPDAYIKPIAYDMNCDH